MKTKKFVYVITLLFTILAHLLSGQMAEFDPEELIPRLMEEKRVPGVAFATLEGGQVTFIKSFGFADYLASDTLLPVHSFNVGSISKTFTAWGVMKLVEQGKLNLSDPLSKFDINCEIHIDSLAKATITIRDLLQHTAGLSVHGYEGYLSMEELPTLCNSIRGLGRDEEKIEMLHIPASEFLYSGGGYTLIQIIIESITGMKFAEYMDKELFSKLGMLNTSFAISQQVLKQSTKAHDTLYRPLPFEHFTAKAAAGLQTTIGDMVKFVKAHFKPNDVLTSMSIALLQEGSQHSNNDYGMGYMILERFGVFTLQGHGGSNDGFQAGMMIDMENKAGFIMLTNGMNGKEVIFPTLMQWGMTRRNHLAKE